MTVFCALSVSRYFEVGGYTKTLYKQFLVRISGYYASRATLQKIEVGPFICARYVIDI